MSFQIKIFISLLLSLITVTSLYSKDKNLPECSISGVITLSNGTPAANAVVGIISIKKFVLTDDKGNYTLENIPYNNYTLEVNTVEAEPKQITIDCKSPKLDLSIEITERVVESESIMIVSKSDGAKIKDKGFALKVVDTQKSILSSLQATDLLNRATGIKLRQSGGVGSDIQYNINGLSGNSIRIFIDGIPIRNYGSSFSLSSIPPSMIERIEIYKGVIPANLTEDALGGAVNVILKKSSINNLATSYSFGSFNTHRWDMNGNYRDDKTGFTAGGSAFYTYTDNSYKVWGEKVYVTSPVDWRNTPVTAKRFHDSYESAGVNANVGFTHTKWADRFQVGLLYSEMQKDIQHGATMEVVYGSRRSLQDTKMVNLRYEKANIVKNLDVSVFSSYSSGVRQVVDTSALKYNWLGELTLDENGDPYEWGKGGGEAGAATLASNLEKNLASRANVSYRIVPNHSLSLNFLYNRFTRDVEDPLLPRAEQLLTDTRFLTKKILSLAYENSLVDDRLKFTAFYKHYMQDVNLKDPYELDNGQYSSEVIDRSVSNGGYGGAASFKITPKVQLMLSAEEALRLPSSNELLGNTSSNIVSSYDLLPESSTNFNIGVILGPYVVEGHSFMADLNLFYRDIDNMIQRAMTTSVTDDMYAYENIGKIQSKGFDLDLRYNYNGKFFVDFGMSNFNARYNLRYDTNGVEYVFYGDRLRNAPYLTMNTNVSYIVNDLLQRGSRLALNYNMGYVHEFFRNWESLGSAGKATIPTQIVHDAGVVYTFPTKKISLAFDAKNILNEQVFDNWALQRPGRALFIKLSYNIIN